MILKVKPCPKPRMTKSDRWKKRATVLRYWDFCDEIRRQSNGFVIPERVHFTFYIPMPDSWSKKKKQLMDGKPHQSKPDWDNLSKAVCDALQSEDSYIWDARGTKVWANEGAIRIEEM